MSSKRIMLVLTRTFGDVLLANSLAQDIKDKYGDDTEITLFVNKEWMELCQYNKNFKTLLCKDNWLQNWDYILGKVIGNEYDKIMIPQQTRHEDTIWHQYDYLRHNHLLNYYQLRCGLPVRKTPLEFHPNPKSEVPLDVDNQEYVVVHCQSGNPDKDFQGFPFLNRHFREAGYEVFQVGGNGDAQIVDNEHRFKGTFTDIWHLIRNAQIFVGLDSGLSMLAATTGTLSFQLCGCTIPKTSGGYGDNFYHIIAPPCATCRPIRCHAHCKSEPNCISQLKVDSVYNFIDKKIESIIVQK